MNIFDRITAIFRKPKLRAQPAALTDGGGYRTTRFAGQKFFGGLSNPAPSLLLDSEAIRRHVRRLSHESLQARALIERDVDTTIAQGLNLAPEPKYETLGVDSETAKDWASDVKTRFELWAMSPRSCRNGQQNFFQAQRLMRKALYRDGEIFVALSYHNDSKLLSPLRFQILDPDQIRENGLTWTAGGCGIGSLNREGIIRNADGEETAYKVWQTDGRGIQTMIEIPRNGRGGRAMMLHAITGQDYAGQLRGISPLHVAIQDLENILNFTQDESVKADLQAKLWVALKNNGKEPTVDPFRGVPPIPDVRNNLFSGGDAQSAPAAGEQNGTPEQSEPVYKDVPHTQIKSPGIGIFNLPEGQELQPFASTSPTAQYETFLNTNLSHIAASQGKSLGTTLNQYLNNYSASRAELLIAWKKVEQLRWELDYYILGPVYEAWLSEEIAAGRVSAPGFADPRIREAWIAHRFVGNKAPNIDPRASAEATVLAAGAGLVALDDAATDYNDSDIVSNINKNERFIAMLRKSGVDPFAKTPEAKPADNEKET